NGRLIAEGVVSRDTPAAREIVASGKKGFPWQASIGASVEELEFIKRGVSVMVNGRKFNGPVYVAHKTTLNEISFVDLGADQRTRARIAAQHKDNKENSSMPEEDVTPTEETPSGEETQTTGGEDGGGQRQPSGRLNASFAG